MRHAFKFPKHVQDAVRRYVERAAAPLDQAHFRQEPAYTAALLGRLTGVAHEYEDAFVSFHGTRVDSIDTGAPSAGPGRTSQSLQPYAIAQRKSERPS
jgi:hypothetical protein